MANALDLDALKPGQPITCTVVKAPVTEDDEQTVLRLMRQDVAIRRALAKSQRERVQNLYIRSRGGRPWEVRRKSASIAKAHKGATWTMKWAPGLAGDFRAVADLIQVAK